MKTNELQSKTIDWLRFPLILGVLFIHNEDSFIIIPGVEFGINSANMPVFYYCSTFFSQVLGRVAVPLFFFISGFLFFLNMDSFNRNIYGKKLRTRTKTLLVPYLFWNLLVISFFLIIGVVPALNRFVNNSVNLQNVLSLLWGITRDGAEMTYPKAYQFWFIRDLMVTVLLTPIIYFVCKRTKIYGIAFLGILWFFGWWFEFVGARGLSSMAIFFFTAGAYLSINKRNLIDDMGKVKRLSFALYPLLALVDLFTKQYAFNDLIHNAGIIIGIVFVFNLAAFLLKTGKVKVNKFLSVASFFVFAVHEPILLTSLRKITYMILKPETDIVITSLYFLNVIIVVLVALVLYYMMRHFFPKFTGIITGGR
jgi:surface polysaccharide O-acyltransferase-like enzyme